MTCKSTLSPTTTTADLESCLLEPVQALTGRMLHAGPERSALTTARKVDNPTELGYDSSTRPRNSVVRVVVLYAICRGFDSHRGYLAPIAQWISAVGFYPKGRGFESL
jgi:hypothetical protein